MACKCSRWKQSLAKALCIHTHTHPLEAQHRLSFLKEKIQERSWRHGLPAAIFLAGKCPNLGSDSMSSMSCCRITGEELIQQHRNLSESPSSKEPRTATAFSSFLSPWPEGFLQNFLQKEFVLIFWPLAKQHWRQPIAIMSCPEQHIRADYGSLL